MKQIAASFTYLVAWFAVAMIDKYVFGGTGNLSPAVIGALIVSIVVAFAG